MRTRTTARMFATGAAVVLGVALASPAVGTGHTGGPGTYYTPPDPYSFTDPFDPECAGQDLTVDPNTHGVYSERNVIGSEGQAFLFRDSFKFHEVWKDNSTGDVVFYARGRYVVQEVFAKRVKKSDVPEDLIPEEGLVGPIFLFTQVERGWDIIRDADHKSLYRTRGVVVYKNLFDTLGDHAPGGTSLSFDLDKVIGPHPLLDVDICDVAAQQAS